MGYELKMYVVEKSKHCKEIIGLIDGKVYNIFTDINKKDEEELFYYPDHDTKTIVPKGSVLKYDGSYLHIIGMIELSKCGMLDINSVCSFENSDGNYMYSDNGNDLIGLDLYGSYRRFIPIEEVIDALKESNKKESYRRFDIALAMLKSVKKTFSDNIGCVFFGH